MRAVSIAIVVCMLLAVALALGRGGGTKKQLKSKNMMHKSGRREMKAAAEQQYSGENYDAYMDFDPHRKAWDRYTNDQKRAALVALYNKYIATNLLNISNPSKRALETAILPSSTAAQLNAGFTGIHGDVNDNLGQIARQQKVIPKSRY